MGKRSEAASLVAMARKQEGKHEEHDIMLPVFFLNLVPYSLVLDTFREFFPVKQPGTPLHVFSPSRLQDDRVFKVLVYA